MQKLLLNGVGYIVSVFLLVSSLHAQIKIYGIVNADNKSKLRVAVDNIFNDGKFNGVTDIPAENIYSTVNLTFMFRTVKATYRYNFGNNKLRDKRNGGTASDEEQGRVK